MGQIRSKDVEVQRKRLSREVATVRKDWGGRVPIDKVRQWENEFHRFMETAHPEIAETVTKDKALSDDTIGALKAAIDEFKKQVVI